MTLPTTLAVRVAVFLLALTGLASADSPPLLTTGVEIGSSNEKTALNRATRKLSSTVDVKIKNTSDRLLEAPFHAVITFTPLNGGNLTGLTMPNTQGGIGAAPYQTFYKDLSTSIGNGLAAGAETTFSFTYERPSDTTVTYTVAVHGIRNTDPVAAVGGPYSGQQGVTLAFTAGGSSDPDGDSLTFAWDFGDGGTAGGAAPEHTFASSGIFTVTLTATDARGAAVSKETQVPISPPGVFALARTRTLDGNGHPLGDVTITQSDPDGSHTFVSDSISGFSSLGGSPGDHSWSFERSGYLTSFRKSTLEQGQVKVVPFPWLTALNANRTTLSLLNPTPVLSSAGRVTLTMPTGAFDQVQSVAITELHGQSLPLPLPFGWSPLAAFHLDMPGDSAVDIPASLKLLQPLATTQTAVLAWLDTDALIWKTQSLITGTSTDTLATVLRKPGSYAVVIADTLPAGNPATAQVDQPLPAGTAPAIAAEVTAIGQVNPATTVASIDPAKVTAQATVDFTNHTQPLASGAWFLADVGETYDLRDGQLLKTPDYDATFYAYQSPGDTLAPTATANFPLLPRLLYGPDQLTEAHIKVDVLSVNRFSGGIITSDGGKLSIPGVQVTVPTGAVGGPAAAEIRPLSPTNLAGFLGGFQALLAFEINLPPLADGTALDLAITQKLTPGSNFVLARCVSTASESGLQPVLRLHSDAQGQITSAEPATGPRLPGINGSGQYVVVQISDPEALVTGLVRKVGGSLLPGAIVRASGEPWLSLTGNAGTFFTLVKPGERTVTGTDPADGNSGQATATLADADATANVEIQTATTGPRVVSTSPNDGATKVKTVTPVSIKFSEPLDLSSFGPDALTLTAGTDVVVGSLSMNAAGTEAIFLPSNPLAASTLHTITLAATIRDRQALALEGPRTYTFTTAAPTARGDGGQLVIYEPDAVNIPAGLAIPGYNPAEKLSRVVAVGSAGTADPEVPVILVNETTGETATVLSKPDGSFGNFIPATEEDYISAVFVNANGTRVTIPATRQNFDDGRIGLYKQGGILEAQSDGGPVQVIVEPSTVADRAVFRFENLGVAELLAMVDNELPPETKLLGGIRLNSKGVLKSPVEITFPVDPANLNLPSGATPEKAGFIIAQPDSVDGVPVFNIVEKATYSEGKIRTASPPFDGILPGEHASGVYCFFNELFAPSLAVIHGQVLVLPEGTPPLVYENRDVLGLRFPNAPGSIVSAGGNENLTGFGRGAFVSRTNGGGFYAIQVPIQGQTDVVSLFAINPLFPGKVARSQAVSNGVAIPGVQLRLANLAFFRPRGSEDTSAPFATLENTASFLPLNQEVSVFMDLVDDTSFPDVKSLGVTFFDSSKPNDKYSREILAGDSEPSGAPLTADDVTFTRAANTKIGTHTTRVEIKLTVKKASLVVIHATQVFDEAANARDFLFPLVFLPQKPPAQTDPITASDPKDTVSPSIRSIYPGHGVTVVDGDDVLVNFSEAISRSAESGTGLTAMGSISGNLAVALKLGSDQLSAHVKVSGAQPGEAITLSFSSTITDLSGNALEPLTETYQVAKVLKKDFTTVGSPVAVSDLRSGQSVVVERIGTGDGRLALFRQGSDLSPSAAVGSLSLPPFPRVMAVVDNFEFRRQHASDPVEKKTLVVVAGGLLGADADGASDPAWLWVVDLSDPAHPTRLASAVTGVDFAASTTKLKVSRGDIYMAVQTPERAFLQIVNLQSLILGSNLPKNELVDVKDFVPDFSGDLNQDGDFVDAGEILPKVSNFGLAGYKSAIPLESNMTLNDFDVDGATGSLVAVFRGAGADGQGRYQTILFGGEVIGLGAAGDQGGVSFPQPANPFRVMLDRNLTIEGASGPRFIQVAAIVVLQNRLVIYDIASKILFPEEVLTVRLPADSGNILHLSRAGGNYLAATSNKTYVISRAKLDARDAARSVSPAVIAALPVGSLGRNLGATPFQLTGISEGILRRIVLPPPMSVVRIASAPGVTPVLPLQDAFDLAGKSAAEKADILARSTEEAVLTPVRFNDLGPAPKNVGDPDFRGALFEPALADRHYHVRVNASGELGKMIKLCLESTDESGRRLTPHGLVHAPVILTDTPATAGVDGDRQPAATSQSAYRLSDDPDDALYNVYLSQPFVLTGDSYSAEIGTKLASRLGRQALQVGSKVRVSIESADNPIPLGDLITRAPSTDPDAPTGVSRSFTSFRGDFLDSPNPSTPGASVSNGGVDIQSGEFQHSTVDFLIETPGQELELRRTYQSGTHVATGFGRGWDFEFNMRLLELKQDLLPASFEYPLVVFPLTQKDRNVVARTGDVILQTGGSDLAVFRRVSPENGNENLRPLMQADPAIFQFGWTGKILAFYQAPEGSFDLLMKLSDGVFVLVDSAGKRTYYRPDGSLERIVFPYEASKVVLSYRNDGRLDRVTGDGDTTLKFGYYQFPKSLTFQREQDVRTENAWEVGLIARVISEKTTVTYHYDESGSLTSVDGPIAKTVYGYDKDAPHQMTSISRDDGGKPPGQKIFYSDGLVKAVEVDGRRTEYSGAAKTAADRADVGAATPAIKTSGPQARTLPHDSYGHPTEILGQQIAFSKEGFLQSMGDPATGMRITYDASNPVYRFRGNVIQTSQGTSSVTAIFDGSAWNRLKTQVNDAGVATTSDFGPDGAMPGDITTTTGTMVRKAKFNKYAQLVEETIKEGDAEFKRTVTFDSKGIPTGMKIGDAIISKFDKGSRNEIKTFSQGTITASPSFSAAGQFTGVTVGGMDLAVANDANSGRTTSATLSSGGKSFTQTFSSATGKSGDYDHVALTETGLPDQNIEVTNDASGRTTKTARNGVETLVGYQGTRATSLRQPGLSKSMTADTQGRPKTVTEQGTTMTFNYTPDGRIASREAQGATHKYTYGNGDQVIRHDVEDATGTPLSEIFSYDSVGRVKTATVNGVASSYEYFPDNSIRSVSINGIERNRVEKDEAGLPTKVSLFQGAIQTNFEDFEPNYGQPRVVKTTLLDGTSLRRVVRYDDLGRLTQVTDPGDLTQRVEYDDFGQRSKEIDADGVTTQRTYSPMGLPLTQTFGDGTSVAYVYNDNLTTRSKGDVQYSYDAELLPAKTAYPDGTQDEYLQRNAFMLPEQVKLGSNTHRLTYANGRLSQMSATLGDELINFTHDGLGRATEITRNGYFIRYGYSQQAGTISEETPLGKWSIEADGQARISSEQYPSGWVSSFSPDSVGVPTEVTELGIDGIDWHSLELPKRVHFKDGREIRWSFDEASRVTGIEYRNADGVVAGFEYGLTPGGRVLSEARVHEHASDVFVHNEPAAGMRVRNALFSVPNQGGQGAASSLSNIAYDANGEIDFSQVAISGGGARSITPGPSDSLVLNDQGSVSEGPLWVNLQGVPQRFDGRFSYDAFGYLQKVERIEAGAVTVTVVYQRDGRGRIVGKKVTGSPLKCVPGEWRYAWTADRLIEEYEVAAPNATPHLLTRYLYVNDILITVQRVIPGLGLKNFIPLCSRNGSVGGFLDESGLIAEFTRFGLFGLPEHVGLVSGVASARSAISGCLQFQGAFFDEETGLYFMGTRTLNPVFGRFLERDTDFYSSSRAFYTAFNGDPASYVDPGGTDAAQPSKASVYAEMGPLDAIHHYLLKGGLRENKRAVSFGGSDITQKQFEFSVNRNSKAIGVATKLLKTVGGAFPPEDQQKLKVFTDVLDIAKHSLRFAEEVHDYGKNKWDYIAAGLELDHLEGLGAAKRMRYSLNGLGVSPLAHRLAYQWGANSPEASAIRNARETFAFTREGHWGSYTGIGGAVIGVAKIALNRYLNADEKVSQYGMLANSGLDMADNALSFAGALAGNSIATTQLGLRAGNVGLENAVFARSTIGGGFLDVPASGLAAKAFVASSAYQFGYGFGKGLITFAKSLADPDDARRYVEMTKMVEDDGGVFGFRTAAGALVTFSGGFLVSAPMALNNLADLHFTDVIINSSANRRVDAALTGLDKL